MHDYCAWADASMPGHSWRWRSSPWWFPFFTTFLAFGYEFELRPRHSACCYGQQVPRRQWVLAFSLVPPVTAVTAAILSLGVRPWNSERVAPSLLLLLLAVGALAVWINWSIGIEAIGDSQRIAGSHPIQQICPDDLEAPG